MDELYITCLQIEKVRHLKNITIPIGKDEKKHLIITGKNGSGKTSLLDALAAFLEKEITGEIHLDAAGKLTVRWHQIIADESTQYLAEKLSKSGQEKIGIELNHSFSECKKCFLMEDVSLPTIKQTEFFMRPFLPMWKRSVCRTYMESMKLRERTL